MQQIIYAKERFSETLKEFLFMFIKLFFFLGGGFVLIDFIQLGLNLQLKYRLK